MREPLIKENIKKQGFFQTIRRLLNPPTLHDACKANDVELLKQIIASSNLTGAELKAMLNERKNFKTALHVAVIEGSYECAEELLKRGADPNIGSSATKFFPLHETRDPQMVQLLWKYGANPDLRDGSGFRPFDSRFHAHLDPRRQPPAANSDAVDPDQAVGLRHRGGGLNQ